MRRRIFTSLTLALFAGCGGDPTGPDPRLEGGIVATFQVSLEEFQVWITNEATIQQVLELRDGRSTANIPNGAIRTGPGVADHNAPWSWHLHPEDIAMAEQTVEVCDGRPSQVESLLEDYLIVGRFCPWGAELVRVDDYR